jgi:hypothetical protein
VEFFKELGANFVLWTAIASWFAAQVIKFILVLITQKNVDFKRLIGSGGMPSSHSSIVSAMAVAVGLCNGFSSIEFAICTVIAFVVMYDACGVRRSAGQHAQILNKIIQSTKGEEKVTLKELLGHTPVEVLAGAILGILIAIIAYHIK